VKRNNFIERSLSGTFSFLRESIFSDEYASRKGFLQARDPKIKALIVLMLLLAVMFSRDIRFLAGIYALCLLLACVSSIGLGYFLKRTWIFIPLFSLFVAIPAIFDIFSPGEPLLTIRIFSLPLIITKQGLASAGFFFSRVLASVSLCVLLVLTTRYNVLLKVLRLFKVPQVFVMTLGMCYRYVYLFIEILQNTYMAIKSRVGHIVSVKKGQGVVAWNIASLWQRSYALHNQVYDAMLSRGYDGEPKVMDEFRATYLDWFWLGVAILVLGLSLWQKRFLN